MPHPALATRAVPELVALRRHVIDSRPVSEEQKGRAFVALAAVAWSTAGLFQRELSVDTATQIAGRAAFAALGLLIYVVAVERRETLRAFRAIGLSGLAVAALIAVASASFIAALNHASVANVLFVMALGPVLAAALGTLVGDPVDRRTWAAMAIAIVGVGVMVGGPGHPSALGQLLSLIMSASFAGALVITRHRREISMAPATFLSQLVLLLAFAPFASFGSAGPRDVTLLAALGVAQYCLGFVFLTIGARLIPAGEVALITLLEIVLGPAWVWVFLSERPPPATLVGGAIVLAAVLFQVRARPAPVQPVA
jgi:drug/metabolite transporter (DMT)-like permease